MMIGTLENKMLSVVIPVFNAEAYLMECVDSILAQSYQGVYEIILVDDGSTDDSAIICDEYQRGHGKIRAHHQINGGSNAARKKGVELAKGEWITFVDADDTLPSDALGNLMSATGSMTDIVIGRIDDRDMPKEMSLEDYRRCCISGRQVHSGPVARAYRTRLFNDKTFDIPKEIRMGEDFVMNVRISFNMQVPPKFVDKTVYRYRRNMGSIMHTNKHTVEHATRFVNEVISSIPISQQSKFTNELNFLRWKSLALIVQDVPADSGWRRSEFARSFYNDVNNGRIKLTSKQKMMLWPRNRFMLKVIYLLLRIW